MAGNYSYNRYNGRGRGNGGNQGNSQGGRNDSKKSGAVYSRIKSGKNEGGTSVNAWRRTRNGLMTASGFPVDGVEHTSKAGKVYLRYAVEIINRDLGTTQTYWCLMDKHSKKIFIKELGLVISPNGSGMTKSGKRVSGYFGKVFN